MLTAKNIGAMMMTYIDLSQVVTAGFQQVTNCNTEQSNLQLYSFYFYLCLFLQ